MFKITFKSRTDGAASFGWGPKIGNLQVLPIRGGKQRFEVQTSVPFLPEKLPMHGQSSAAFERGNGLTPPMTRAIGVLVSVATSPALQTDSNLSGRGWGSCSDPRSLLTSITMINPRMNRLPSLGGLDSRSFLNGCLKYSARQRTHIQRNLPDAYIIVS